MLVAGMMISLSGAIYASMGERTPFTGRFSQLAASYQGQGNNTALQGFSCTTTETISASMISDEWQQAFREVLPMSAVNLMLAGTGEVVPLTEHSVTEDVARNFRRIEILLYAQTRVPEVSAQIDMPSHAREAALAKQARYNSVMQMGMNTQMQELHLPDASGEAAITAENSHYLNSCLNSSRRFVAKVIAEFRTMYQEAEQPLSRGHLAAEGKKDELLAVLRRG